MFNDELRTLGTMASFCANLVDESSIRTDVDGNQTVLVDDATVTHNKKLFTDIQQRILTACRNSRGPEALSELTELLRLFSSYLFFERVGKGISDDRWKAAFRLELTEVYAQVCDLCEANDVAQE